MKFMSFGVNEMSFKQETSRKTKKKEKKCNKNEIFFKEKCDKTEKEKTPKTGKMKV